MASREHKPHQEPRPTLVYCKWCHKTHAVSIEERPCGDSYTNWIEESTGLDWAQVLSVHQITPTFNLSEELGGF